MFSGAQETAAAATDAIQQKKERGKKNRERSPTMFYV